MFSQMEFLQSFISDLLDLRQLKSGSIFLVKEDFSVVSVIKNLCEIFNPQLEMKQITINAILGGVQLDNSNEHWPGNLMPQLLGDGRRFKQVLINLVRNAIKFTKAGMIEIKADYQNLPGSLLRVSVRDTGAGIDRDEINSLFTRFGKLQRTADMNSEGLGLGLTIVKEIVELTGG